MTEQIWVALIGAAALLVGTILGYALRGRAKQSAERKEVLQAQLDRVYARIYGLLKDAVPSDEPLSEIDLDTVEEIIRIATSNRKLLERRLEATIDSMQEGLYSFGPDGIDARDLGALWQHVHRMYNDLRKGLGLPHTPHWTKRPVGEVFTEIRSRWWVYTWEREKSKRRAGAKRHHRR